ncbi:17586_t:CDS:2 [Rhizophagus irregularis]|nr:17586_t:CDS:2 [Rhizophagus irregularis]
MKYFGILSKDYNETFKSGEFHDIEILVGKKPDTKIFKLHSLILKIRSPFFRNELKNNKKLKYKNNIIEYNKPNISVKIFDILVSIFDIDFYVQILEYYSSNEESHSKFGNNLMNINSNIINSDHAFLLGNFIKIAVQHDRPTITVVSVKNTDEILGGYNPLNFESTGSYCLCENSFLFSLDKNKLTNFIFSKVVDKCHAVYDYGIGFGEYRSDLRLLENNTNVGQCYKNSYEKLIRKRAGKFKIDDYEVFLVKTK